MNKRLFILLMLSLTSFLALTVGCHKMPVGYLYTDEAEYSPSELMVYKQPDPKSERATNGAPWVSLPIQGVMGTVPINYEIVSVKGVNGADVAIFRKQLEAGKITNQGSIVQVFPEAAKALPLGRYIITLSVFNEGYSALLEDILTIVVEEQEPIKEDDPWGLDDW